MKRLIFSGLVLGSSAYLLATQTDLLPNSVSKHSELGDQQISEPMTASVNLEQQVKSISDSALVQELKASIRELEAELAQLKQDLQGSKASRLGASLAPELMPTPEPPLRAEAALPRRDIVPDAVSVSPYMPAKERSDALIDLAQRMEMKAAAY